MDPITHGLVGALSAKTLKTSRRRFWIMAFLGNAPDLDVLCVFLGPWAFWLQHRGFSHSLLGCVVQAVLCSALFMKWDQGSFTQRAAHYFMPLLLHAFCDYATSYGVPLFSPFVFREFSLDLAPAVTVIPILFMGIGLFVMHRRKTEGLRAARPMWVCWGLYFAFMVSSRAYAVTLVKQSEGPPTLVAGLMNPVGWTAVVVPAPYLYQSYRINVLTGNVKKGARLETELTSFAVQASLSSAYTKKFVGTLRWPVARVLPGEPDGWVVQWGKMIFSSRGVVRGLWAVDVSPEGSVRSEKRIVEFWDPDENKI